MDRAGRPNLKRTFFLAILFLVFASLSHTQDSGSLADLPIIEVPSSGPATDKMGILITGDGGWGTTDRGIAEALASNGIPVVGLNSLRYFWKRRTPETAAADLARIIKRYAALWNRPNILVIGYSFGADVLSFMLNRIPRDMLQQVKLISFLGVSSTADFQFHLTDWISNRPRPTSLPIRPELEKLRGKKILCFYGKDDGDAICKDLDASLAKAVALNSGHRIGREYARIVEMILNESR